MIFDAPWALLALAAAGIPVVLHLMRRRDLPTVTLPTIALLRRARASSRRRLELRDLWLLLARVALIAALALIPSGPRLRAPTLGASGRAEHLIVLLDDSMSMSQRAHGGGTAFDAARADAIAAIRALGAGSEVSLVLGGAPARIPVSRASDPSIAIHVIEALQAPSARGTDLATAARTARQQASGGNLADRRLLALSDYARHAEAESAPFPSAPVAIEHRRFGDDAPANRGILRVTVVPHPTVADRLSIEVEARVGEDEDEALVRLERGDAVLAEAQLPAAGGVARGILQTQRPTGADPTAWVHLVGDDALPADDRHGVLLRLSDAIRVLVANGDPSSSPLEDETSFLSRALEASAREARPIAVRVVDPEAIDDALLRDADVVVLANVGSLGRARFRALRAFVAGGGGALIAAGDKIAPQAYSTEDDWLPARIVSRRETNAVLGMELLDDTVLPAESPGFSRARTSARLELDPAISARVVARFPDGLPALVTASEDRGRVAMFATSLDAAWTDLPFRPGFPALMIALVRMLAPTGESSADLVAPGATIELRVPPGLRTLEVLAPDGSSSALDPDEPTFEVPDLAGPYRALADGVELPHAAFVVAPPASEIDLTPGPLPESRGTLPDDASSTEGRIPLAPWLLLLAASAAVVEGWLRYAPRRPERASPVV